MSISERITNRMTRRLILVTGYLLGWGLTGIGTAYIALCILGIMPLWTWAVFVPLGVVEIAIGTKVLEVTGRYQNQPKD